MAGTNASWKASRAPDRVAGLPSGPVVQKTIAQRRREHGDAEARGNLLACVENGARPAGVFRADRRENRHLERNHRESERPAAQEHDEPDPPLARVSGRPAGRRA